MNGDTKDRDRILVADRVLWQWVILLTLDKVKVVSSPNFQCLSSECLFSLKNEDKH